MKRAGHFALARLLAAAAALVAALVVAPQHEARAYSGGGASGGGGSVPAPSGRGTDPARAYQEGVAALQARDYRTAVSRLRSVVDVAPTNMGANYAYALALIGNGDARAAVRPLERALRSEDAPPDVRKQLGLVRLQLGDRDKASEQLTALATALAACDATCGDMKRAQIQNAHDALKAALDAPATPAAPTTGQGRSRHRAASGPSQLSRLREPQARPVRCGDRLLHGRARAQSRSSRRQRVPR
ncbi:MAG: hypothetical protein FD124_3484 [Alphaproteobacteria bacterium]|nr:MAG: hypothetical protein FD124_3484 [Alphaproteobacteria bacterium]